jgi:predicted nucleic acid-binding protein
MDTGAFLALINPHDTNHQKATECLNMIARHRLPVFVAVPTIYESYRRILFDLGPRIAKRFLQELYDGSVTIVRTMEEDEREARRLLERYEGLQLTLTDSANMAVMARLGIAQVFSFDRHYLQAGFARIPPFSL